MKIGIVESNGAQNYVNWDIMKTYLPSADPLSNESIYLCGEQFYQSNRLFTESAHYLMLALEGAKNG